MKSTPLQCVFLYFIPNPLLLIRSLWQSHLYDCSSILTSDFSHTVINASYRLIGILSSSAALPSPCPNLCCQASAIFKYWGCCHNDLLLMTAIIKNRRELHLSSPLRLLPTYPIYWLLCILSFYRTLLDIKLRISSIFVIWRLTGADGSLLGSSAKASKSLIKDSIFSNQ